MLEKLVFWKASKRFKWIERNLLED